MESKYLEKPYIIFAKSSAGSGKTHNLALQYIKHLLNTDYSKLNFTNNLKSTIAITFTNKAANEMKQRIIKKLKTIHLLNSFQETFTYKSLNNENIKEQEIIKKNYNQEYDIVKEIIDNYEDFKVQTIDSFITYILHLLAYDMEIPSDFEVVTNTEQYFDFVLSELLNEPLNNEKIKNAFLKFLDLYLTIESAEKQQWDPKKNILKRIKNIFDTEKNTGLSLNTLLPPIIEEPERNAQEKFLCVIEIYNSFKEKLNSILKKEKKLLIDELNIKLSNYLKNKDEVLPVLYYYLGYRYNNFLIDEFQDTSKIQWENIKPILEEMFSKGGTFFAVGDNKQSIYGWRGADYNLIHEIENNPPQQVNNLWLLELNKNFRSGEKIINFVTQIFEKQNLQKWLLNNIKLNNAKITKNDLMAKINENIKIYENVNQECIDQNKNIGYVFAQVFEKGKKDDQLKLIKEALKEKLKIIIQKNYKFGDIAILVRENEEISTVIEWLSEFEKEEDFKNLQIESKTTISIANNPVICDIINFLKFLDKPYENINFFAFLTGETFYNLMKKNNAQLDEPEKILKWLNEKILNNKEIPLYQIFRNEFQQIWNEYFDTLFRYTDYMPLYDFIYMIFNKFKLFSLFPDYTIYFIKFLDFVQNVSNEKNSLPEFLEYWKESEKTGEEFLIPSTENPDAIKVITMHSAKGLEFPVVILPFVNSGTKNVNEFFEIENDKVSLYYITKQDTQKSEKLAKIYYENKLKTFIDELNLFYVSCTRAKYALFIFFMRYKNSLTLDELLSEKNQDNTYEYGEFIDKYDIPEYKKSQNNELSKEPGLDKFSIEDILKIEPDKLLWMETLKKKVSQPEDYEASLLGEAVHYALSLVKFLPDEKINEKIEIAAKKFRVDKKEIENQINIITKNPDFKKFFDSSKIIDAYNEVEVIDNSGRKNRIDRLIFYKDRIEIVDYKTGAEPKENIEEHKEQINKYAEIIAKIYNKKIKGYLIYLTTNEIVEVI